MFCFPILLRELRALRGEKLFLVAACGCRGPSVAAIEKTNAVNATKPNAMIPAEVLRKPVGTPTMPWTAR